MKRRDFLLGTVAVTGLASTTRLWAQANVAKLARLGVSSRSFAVILKTGIGPAANAARTLDFLDLPQAIADRFGVHNLVLHHSHFVSTEDAYLKDFKDRVARAKSQIVQISTEFQGSNVSAGGFSARAQGIDLAKVWIDHAEALGCPRIVINAGSLSADVRTAAIDALKILAEYGKAHKVTVSVENRDTGAPPPAPPPPPPVAAPAAGAAPGAAGAAAGQGRGRGGGGGGQPAAPPPTWQVLADAAKAAGLAVTPDSAAFPNEAERTAGLKALYPLSDGNSFVHAASLAAAVKIARDAGYKGLFTIVTDGGGADPYGSTKAGLEELVKAI